jgi:hypothetical protein
MRGGGKSTKAEPQPVEIPSSLPKLVILSIPSFLIGIFAAYDMSQAQGVVAQSRFAQVAAVALGCITGGVLLQMGIDRKPVLRIDHEGIRCRRPNTGLIPWSAVAGLAVGRALLVRSVLMVAIETDADPKLLERLRRYTTGGMLGMLTPQARRFRGQLQGRLVVQIPISMLAASPQDIQRIIEERVQITPARR